MKYPGFREIIRNIQVKSEPKYAEQCKCASDGGKKYSNLTFGAVYSIEETIIFEISGRIPQSNRDSSLRAEAFGGLALAMVINAYHEYFEILRPKELLYYVDNKSLIRRLEKAEWHGSRPSKTTAPEQEVIMEMHIINRQNKMKINHVKSHQSGVLSWEAKLNNRCDFLAEVARNYPPIKQYNFHTTTATIKINGIETSSAIPLTLRQTFESQNMREYLQEKYNWGSEIDLIDWTIHNRALNSLQYSHRQTITKFVHEWLPVNNHKGNQNVSTKCPFCMTNDETQAHMLQCSHPLVVSARKQSNDANSCITWRPRIEYIDNNGDKHNARQNCPRSTPKQILQIDRSTESNRVESGHVWKNSDTLGDES